jgi:hypothetical protein
VRQGPATEKKHEARTSYGPAELPPIRILVLFNVGLPRTFAFTTMFKIPFILRLSVPCWKIIIHLALSYIMVSPSTAPTPQQPCE